MKNPAGHAFGAPSELEVRVRFNCPREKWTGAAARAYIGGLLKACGGGQLAPGLFHHAADGTPLQGVPLVRWGSGRGFFRILAIGPQATDLLYASSYRIVTLIQDDLQVPVSLDLVRRPIAITADSRPHFYTAVGMLAARKIPASRRLAAMGPTERLAFLAAKIRRDMIEQATLLGVDVPAGFEVIAQRAGKIIPVRLDDAARQPVASGPKPAWGSSVDVEFMLFAALSGTWGVGGLRAKGFGNILPRRRAVGTQNEPSMIDLNAIALEEELSE